MLHTTYMGVLNFFFNFEVKGQGQGHMTSSSLNKSLNLTYMTHWRRLVSYDIPLKPILSERASFVYPETSVN